MTRLTQHTLLLLSVQLSLQTHGCRQNFFIGRRANDLTLKISVLQEFNICRIDKYSWNESITLSDIMDRLPGVPKGQTKNVQCDPSKNIYSQHAHIMCQFSGDDIRHPLPIATDTLVYT